ncbi:MAG TPA: putative sugar nucleotidyl transferase, partial [Pirellulales bacterium]|nr:putative sugar nucleotidyl transferase [Pirellulales bacterium]
MSIVLFEDEHVTRLDPVAVGKPAFAISCGSYRLIDLVALLGQPIRARVRKHLARIVAADFPELSSDRGESREAVLWINARLVPSAGVLEQLRGLVKTGQPGIVQFGGGVSAALVAPGARFGQLPDELPTAEKFAELGLPTLAADLPLLEYPHDIIRHHLATLSSNLEHRLAGGGYRQIGEGVFAAPEAALGSYAVTDTRRGPIVLEAGATIGPYCYLSGPVHVGRSARVLEHAALKDGVAIGHTAKIGGEVEASIIEPYTNKQHHGFLGHTYLGSWINLGAGTC